MSKFDATRCQIFKLICAKFDFRWGSAPDPAGGAYSAVFKGPTSKGKEGKTGKGKGDGKGKEEEGEGKAPKYISVEPSLGRSGVDACLPQ